MTLTELQAEIEKRAQQRHRHWLMLAAEWSPLRVERVAAITAELNGHNGEWGYVTRRGEGLYEQKRAIRAKAGTVGRARGRVVP